MEAAVLQYRRERMLDLSRQGYSQHQIAQILSVSQPTVSAFLKRYRQKGPAAIQGEKPGKSSPKLSEDQHKTLKNILLNGAQAYGFSGDFWTQRRIALVILEQFGVQYHPYSVCRLLKRIGMSFRKPTMKDLRQDQEKVRKWLADEVQEIAEKKSSITT